MDIEKIIGRNIDCDDVIEDIEDEYSKYINAKYNTPYFCFKSTIKKWQ